ncbi:TPA: hypothetical protein EYP70_05955 [Candidatus Bathyarchaeota archaeon]|nr:hypothetical protein [Candidatus Bathyarchaeota archaeon]
MRCKYVFKKIRNILKRPVKPRFYFISKNGYRFDPYIFTLAKIPFNGVWIKRLTVEIEKELGGKISLPLNPTVSITAKKVDHVLWMLKNRKCVAFSQEQIRPSDINLYRILRLVKMKIVGESLRECVVNDLHFRVITVDEFLDKRGFIKGLNLLRIIETISTHGRIKKRVIANELDIRNIGGYLELLYLNRYIGMTSTRCWIREKAKISRYLKELHKRRSELAEIIREKLEDRKSFFRFLEKGIPIGSGWYESKLPAGLLQNTRIVWELIKEGYLSKDEYVLLKNLGIL